MAAKKQLPPPLPPVVVTDVLDLHGFFPEQIEEVLHEYMRYAVEQGYAEVRLIHGKGKSRLKWQVQQVLRAHPAVADFRDAPPERGGWGATIVILQPPL